jgi:phosphoribosyl-ATP pyrophosphohydrolase
MFSKKVKKLSTTPFSSFVRDASSRKKKKIYKKVLEEATEMQNNILEKASNQ